jgi:hypothetical protein
MIPINHILVLSQPEFVRQQLENAMSGERLPYWRRRSAK